MQNLYQRILNRKIFSNVKNDGDPNEQNFFPKKSLINRLSIKKTPKNSVFGLLHVTSNRLKRNFSSGDT